jgi:hypothetical protein
MHVDSCHHLINLCSEHAVCDPLLQQVTFFRLSVVPNPSIGDVAVLEIRLGFPTHAPSHPVSSRIALPFHRDRPSLVPNPSLVDVVLIGRQPERPSPLQPPAASSQTKLHFPRLQLTAVPNPSDDGDSRLGTQEIAPIHVPSHLVFFVPALPVGHARFAGCGDEGVVVSGPPGKALGESFWKYCGWILCTNCVSMNPG